MTGDSERGQVTRSAAEIYEEFFVPALFQQWAERVTHAARIQPGMRVLDVACGTGVLARAAARQVGPNGTVTGLDRNPGMLTVARQTEPAVDWHEGRAESLPFDPDFFDAVVSQFGLMFFDDQPAAIREMLRVARPGGTVVIAVWDALERTPGYAAMTELLRSLFGEQIADMLRAPFSLGDPERLAALFAQAGYPGVTVKTVAGTARFPSIESWVHTDIRGWTLAEHIDDEQYERLLREAQKDLRRFVTADGAVAFDAPAHLAVAVKPA